MRDLLVEPDWLAAHCTDPGIRIIDTGSQDAHRRAHIPGAIGYLGSQFLKDEAYFVLGQTPLRNSCSERPFLRMAVRQGAERLDAPLRHVSSTETTHEFCFGRG